MENTNLDLKKNIRRIKVSREYDKALDFLYLFEKYCPKNKEITPHLLAIEEILNNNFYLENPTYIEDVKGYELYVVGYESEEVQNAR